MHRPSIRSPLLTMTTLACLAGATDLRAQPAPSTWRLVTGAGFGLSLAGHDLSETGEPAALVLASVDRRVTDRVRLGLGWAGAWLRGAPGGDSRQAVHIEATHSTGPGSIAFRLGAGFALSTIADVDGPPPGPGVGDATVSIGDTMGASLSAGFGLDRSLADWISLGPWVDVQLQRVDGHTLALIALTGHVTLGL